MGLESSETPGLLGRPSDTLVNQLFACYTQRSATALKRRFTHGALGRRVHP